MAKVILVPIEASVPGNTGWGLISGVRSTPLVTRGRGEGWDKEGQ